MNHSGLLIEKIRQSTGIRLAVLFGSMFFLLIFVSIFSTFISSFPDISPRTSLLVSSTLQCVLVFIIPACLTGYFVSSMPWKWLGISNGINWKMIIGVIIVYIISIPFMNYLISWNEQLSLPESMYSLEQQLRSWEETGKNSTDILLQSQGLGAVIIGVLIIGILTGFAEEIFFRGSLQNIFLDSSFNVSLAIWLSAFIFSAFHFQFFGFVPRLLMGAFFGYLIFWSKSLWLPVFAHALNNSLIVVTYAFNPDSKGESFLETIGTGNGIFPWIAFISGVVTFIFLYYCKDYFFLSKRFDNIYGQEREKIRIQRNNNIN